VHTDTVKSALPDMFERPRAITQLEVIRDVLLSAVECAGVAVVRPYKKLWDSAAAEAPARDSGWMTLRELAELTGYGEASISAQLRHLRKPRFGGYSIAKRRRFSRTSGSVWEYRIAV
jgi:hypothetical protein